MFQRRNPLSRAQRLGQLLWPRQGWGRTGSYVAHRLRRLPGTPYTIAAGFASGAAVSFTPLLGFHFVLAALLAVLIRGNVVASAIGTIVGNPWTFPFILGWIYSVGIWILGGNGSAGLPEGFSFSYLLSNPTYIFENPLKILVPMVVGAVPTATFVWFLCFWPLRRMVDRYQTARQKRLRKKTEKRRAKLAAKTAKAAKAAVPFEKVAETGE